MEEIKVAGLARVTGGRAALPELLAKWFPSLGKEAPQVKEKLPPWMDSSRPLWLDAFRARGNKIRVGRGWLKNPPRPSEPFEIGIPAAEKWAP
jgi:hypothetical protein